MAPGLFQFSRTDSLEVSFFRICKWILRFLGFWPPDPLNRRTIIKIVINLTLLGVAVIGEIRLAWILGTRDPLQALDVICPFLTKMVTWMKLVCFLIYRKELELILKDLFEHCKKDTKNFEKNSMIAKVSHFISKWCVVLYLNHLFTSCLFALKPLIVWGYQYFVKEDRNIWVSLPFQAALPYEDMTQVNDKTLYTFIYCCLAHTGTVTIFGLSGVEGTFLSFCMYISVSYECLQEDFKMTVKSHTLNNIKPMNNDVLYNDLTKLIRRQQNIIEIFKRFNQVYKFMVFFHFVFASITLGIVLVNLLLISGISKLIYLSYALGAGNQLFTYCYGVESVNKNCFKLTEVLYFSDWYKCNKKVKHLILFVLIKSQEGSALKVPFFSPSLKLFASIIQTSGSYFTILQAVL
ncbi:odorant receptor 10a-like [Episyrphus balteatus]|uniref:odorant receptor 10a-like n=1 Tax=Episyrphus balteatus TaxID=286459 RepID=UPI0024860138|nr:odorant receptor 10a-like [Episyrphus balteatus]